MIEVVKKRFLEKHGDVSFRENTEEGNRSIAFAFMPFLTVMFQESVENDHMVLRAYSNAMSPNGQGGNKVIFSVKTRKVKAKTDAQEAVDVVNFVIDNMETFA